MNHDHIFIRNIKFISYFGLFLGCFFFCVGNVYAEVSSGVWNLDSLAQNGTTQDFKIVDTIEITSLDHVDRLAECTNIKYIFVKNLKILDASFLNLDYRYQSLYIDGSLVNVTNLDPNSFQELFITNSYAIGDTTHYTQSQWLNTEFAQEKDYDAKFTEIAKSIYQIDMTDEEIIRAVTRYVTESLEYDYECSGITSCVKKGTAAEIALSGKGVCADYAYLESQLLNKLGIYAVTVLGHGNILRKKDTAHAWVSVYLNGKWYSIDPTWLDNTKDWYTQKSHIFYMADPFDHNDPFNRNHYPGFDVGMIPTEYLESKVAILKEERKATFQLETENPSNEQVGVLWNETKDNSNKNQVSKKMDMESDSNSKDQSWKSLEIDNFESTEYDNLNDETNYEENENGDNFSYSNELSSGDFVFSSSFSKATISIAFIMFFLICFGYCVIFW
ncbi:MAG: transglutaminase-like domain-containing protein [bacterium]|nr:transglutaminase-like domain-containing protein [bacterium]